MSMLSDAIKRNKPKGGSAGEFANNLEAHQDDIKHAAEAVFPVLSAPIAISDLITDKQKADDAAKKKSKHNAQKSADAAIAAQQKMFEEGRADLDPFRSAGAGVLPDLQNLIKNGFNPNDPAYQFQLKQGQAGILSQAGVSGSPWSGQTMKDLTEFNQGLTSNTWAQHVNALMGVAGLGENAAASEMQGAIQTGAGTANTSNLAAQMANARDVAQQNSNNALIGQAIGAVGTGVAIAAMA